MRRILMALIVVAVLAAGCGGDDDGGFGNAAGSGAADAVDGEDASSEDAVGADGEELPDALTDDPDGAVADFPIPSPPGAVDGIATEVDGIQAAQVWFEADRFDEVVDAYEGWFLDNGLIDTPADRSVGQVVLGGENDSGGYTAIIITDGDRVFVQLSVE